MKIRLGFVSNSSSSSFCIIGTRTQNVINKLLIAEGIDLDSGDYEDGVCGVRETGILQFIGSEGECYHVGIDAENLLKTMTIPQACEYFQKEIKNKYDVDVPLSQIRFEYGEICTG